MHNATQASAVAAKAQFDKFVLDKAEEKAEFDRVLEHTAQEAAAQKAVADKALLDIGEMEVGVTWLGYRSGHSGVWDEQMHGCGVQPPSLDG